MAQSNCHLVKRCWPNVFLLPLRLERCEMLLQATSVRNTQICVNTGMHIYEYIYIMCVYVYLFIYSFIYLQNVCMCVCVLKVLNFYLHSYLHNAMHA
jgi:hypothetical protein